MHTLFKRRVGSPPTPYLWTYVFVGPFAFLSFPDVVIITIIIDIIHVLPPVFHPLPFDMDSVDVWRFASAAISNVHRNPNTVIDIYCRFVNRLQPNV